MSMASGPPGWSRPAPILPFVPSDPLTVQATPGDLFAWATVVQTSPLTIQLDTDSTPLPLVPDTLIPPSAMLPYTRVWVQLHQTRQGLTVLVLGVANGGQQWTNATILNGFASRGAGYDPQVMLGASGLVYFRGQMSNTGMSGITTDTQILQLPQGYWPAVEQSWIGYAAPHTGVTYGGWVSPSNGGVWLQYDSSLTAPIPNSHWSIIVAAWVPAPIPEY